MGTIVQAGSGSKVISVVAKDAYGNVAKLDGALQWENTNPEVAAMTVAEDGMSAVIDFSDLAGTTQINFKGDADMGEGVIEVTGLVDFEVLPGNATVLEAAVTDAPTV
ncbi:MAG: hypothetical protein ACKO0Z_28075 [Betaproteobacteria bacterium]